MIVQHGVYVFNMLISIHDPIVINRLYLQNHDEEIDELGDGSIMEISKPSEIMRWRHNAFHEVTPRLL